ncbi:MAG: metallophosphoesterase family protein, partial [Blautia massiliensis (ex Durand et al. 2017)]
MKFLHLADLHLGKRVNGFDMLEDQRYILEEILALCDQHGVEAVVLAGDIYDAPVPPAAACTLLDWFLTRLAARQIPVLAVSGNHDSAERLDFAAGLLAGQGVHLAGRFNGAPRQVVLNDRFGPVEFTLLPFVRAATVRHYMPDADLPDYDSAVAAALNACQPAAARRVLVAHQMVVAGICPPQMAGSESAPLTVGTVDSVDSSRFLGFAYTALGHIHRAQRVGLENVRYAGAPLCYH